MVDETSPGGPSVNGWTAPERVVGAFSGRALDYEQMAWHDAYARAFVRSLPLQAGQAVIDAGAGTGYATRAAARAVGASGRVLAVEVTPAMAQRLDPAAGPDAAPIEVTVGDATRLALAEGSVDVVLCSAALLYMPVHQALCEWHRVLRPGGLVGFSTMEADQPPAARLFRRLAARRGITLRDPAAGLGSVEAATRHLRESGFEGVRVIRDDVGFADGDLEGAWDAHERTHRDELRDLDAAQLTELRRRFEADLRTLPGRHRARVLYAQGRKAAPGIGGAGRRSP